MNGWINVRDDLPALHEAGDEEFGTWMESGDVLVTFKRHDGSIGIGIAEYTESEIGQYWNADDPMGNQYGTVTKATVIAWQPLPEPYKEVEHE